MGTFKIRRNMVLLGGSAQIGADTNIYRTAANILKTDDAFTVGGSATLTGAVQANGGITSSGTVTLTGKLVLPYGATTPTMASNGQVNIYHKGGTPRLVAQSGGTTYECMLPTATGGTTFWTVGTAALP